MSFYYALSQSSVTKTSLPLTVYWMSIAKSNGNEKENDQFILPGKIFLK